MASSPSPPAPPEAPPLNAEQEAEIGKLPPHVQAVARRLRPTTCYREKTNPHTHYVIHSYGSSAAHDRVALKLAHGADSTLPGVLVGGIDPDSVFVCNCGDWQVPTAAQLEAMDEHFKALDRARALAPRKTPGLKLV
jgi:hypothetical protein